MTILVTGASGFLGTAVVERLCAHGVKSVRCFLRPTSSMTELERISRDYPHCELEYLTGNLTSPDDCSRAVDGVSTILHLAAQIKGAPAAMFLNTLVATKRLLEAVRDAPVRRVVLISSLSVYGPPSGRQSTLDENSQIETQWRKRDPYSQVKLWQETVFREAETEMGFEGVVLRPGVLYGPGGAHFPGRLGVRIGDCLWLFGRNSVLPLTHVDNCAEAVVLAGLGFGIKCCYNVVDDDLPTADEYLRAYKKQVCRIRSLGIPWWMTMGLSRVVERYSRFSHGQIPPALTPYKSNILWRGTVFDNRKLKSLGWKQIVSTREGLEATFKHWNTEHTTSRNADSVWQITHGWTADRPSLAEYIKEYEQLTTGER